jgi:hypothetical protein
MRHLDHPPEDRENEGVDAHHEQWMRVGPEESEGGALVTRTQVATQERPQKLTVLKKAQ